MNTNLTTSDFLSYYGGVSPFEKYKHMSQKYSRTFSDDGSLLTISINLAGTKESDITVEFDKVSRVLDINTETYASSHTIPQTYKPTAKPCSYENGLLEITFEKKENKQKLM